MKGIKDSTISDICNAAGLEVGVYFIVQNQIFYCHISLKLWENTTKFTQRIFASKFSKGKLQNFVNSKKIVNYKF